jgi:transcriptional regulator with XRE-family HTH domain
MVDTSGPVTPRRRLAAELRRLREEAGLRLEEVADQLLISRSKLSRLENAQGRPHPRDVRDLIKFYRLDGTPQAAAMTEWLDAARRQPWWGQYRRRIGFDAHIAYESEASTARVYTIPVLPVLLQTPDYVRAFYRSTEYWNGDGQVEELVELRQRRQQVLTDRAPKPLELLTVIHEACLRQVVGSAATMRAQLESVAQWSTAPNIEVRVLPFSAPPTYAMGCAFACFAFDEDDAGIVSIETHAGFRQVEAAKQATEYDRHFRDLQDRSLSPPETRDLLHSVARSYG